MDPSKNELQSMLGDAMHNAIPIQKVLNLTEAEYKEKYAKPFVIDDKNNTIKSKSINLDNIISKEETQIILSLSRLHYGNN